MELLCIIPPATRWTFARCVHTSLPTSFLLSFFDVDDIYDHTRLLYHVSCLIPQSKLTNNLVRRCTDKSQFYSVQHPIRQYR